jgi:hypothetical protein
MKSRPQFNPMGPSTEKEMIALALGSTVIDAQSNGAGALKLIRACGAADPDELLIKQVLVWRG